MTIATRHDGTSLAPVLDPALRCTALTGREAVQ